MPCIFDIKPEDRHCQYCSAICDEREPKPVEIFTTNKLNNMTDKVQKIREEVERLQNELIQEKEKGFGSNTDDACILELQNVLTYIDSLQEDPISEDLGDYINKFSKQFPEVSFAKLSRIAIRVANWQKEQDQETIELAEDHAMLAGIIKGTEHTIGNVRSILNKIAYRNNGLDVNGDYCEQPYIELDNEFKKLLNED